MQQTRKKIQVNIKCAQKMGVTENAHRKCK